MRGCTPWRSLFSVLVLALLLGLVPSAPCRADGMWSTGLLYGMNAVTKDGETSIDFDVGGNYHVSYYDSNTGDLMYYGPTGLETVASAGTVGYHNSISVRGYDIAIAYWDVTNDRLMYAKRNGTSWDFEQVDTGGGMHCSLVIQPQLDQPRIAYYNTTNHDLRYAVRSSGSWSVQTVDAAGNVGQYASLSHQEYTPYWPRIAYTKMNSLEPGQIETDHDLKYAAWNGSSWDIQTVDTQYVVGKHASLVVGAHYYNQPAIAYYRTWWSTTSGQVRHLVYATKNAGSPTWDFTTLDADAGEFASLALDYAGNPRVAYMEYYYPCCEPHNTVLCYQRYDGSNWYKTRITISAGTGWYVSMALDTMSNPAIVHVDPFAVTPQETGLVHFARWIDCPDMTAPTLVGPTGTCVPTTTTLSWEAVTGATNYEVQVGTGCGLGPVESTSETSLEISGLAAYTSHEWRVRAQNACGDWGPWSACMPFHTEPPLPEPTVLNAPVDGASGVALDDVQLQWAAPFAAVQFEYQVGSSCGGGTIGSSAVPSATVGGFAASQTYYWRVRSQNECGAWGAWSGCWSFQTVNTPTGTDVVIEPEPGVSLGFDEVTGSGDTTIDESSQNPGPEVNAYMFLGTFYDINTTATYSGNVEVCIEYDDTGMTLSQELDLAIFHLVDGAWTDITTSIDTNANVICGTTSVLSPFGVALFQPWAPDGTTPALADGSDTVGVSWGDYDRDGDPDLYVTNHMSADKLFRNDGAGVFTDVTAVPLGHTGQGSVGCWADYDGDGDEDLYLVVRGGPNVLYRNDDGTFVDATAPPLDDAGESQGATWFDYDLDGDLDVYVSNYYQANRMYRNDGGSGFTDVTTSPLDDLGQCTGSAASDWDQDGDVDLYVTNTGALPNRLLRNDGGGVWTDVTPTVLALTTESRGAAWGDYDNDGDPDLYVANGAGANQLFRNDGGGSFTDVSSGVLADGGSARGVGWQDFDNDGDLDLYIANLNSANRLARNEGFGIFTDATITPLDDAGYGIGVAWADYDRDGDADLYLGNAFGPNVLFRNAQLTANHWLHVNLSGITSNRTGIGARVRVVAGGLDQVREVFHGSGYVSEGSSTAEFGLGTNAAVDLVEVHWPSGAVSSITSGIGIDRMVTISEHATNAPDAPGETRLYAPVPNPFNPRTTVSFDIAVAGPVRLRIYDSSGRLVRTLIGGVTYEPGSYHEVWNGRDEKGSMVASGVYHLRFEAPGKVETKSMTLIR